MRAIATAVRGIGRAVGRRPVVFATTALATAAASVLLPPLVLSLARKRVDYFTFNPWLAVLPDYLRSEIPAGEKLAKLSNLALFWFSADSAFGIEWGFAVDVRDVGRILFTSLLVGAYFALWAHTRSGLGAWRLRPGAQGGTLGAFVSVVGLSTGPCSVMGCGAPVLPVVGLAFVGLSSGTLAFLASLSSVATATVLLAIVVAVAWLGWHAGRDVTVA